MGPDAAVPLQVAALGQRLQKVVELQDDLDPEDGYSRSEIAKVRKQLADRPDTSDLDWFYKALAPDPDVTYGEKLPIGVDRNGKTRWFVLPESDTALPQRLP